jgi:hypothetical protein
LLALELGHTDAEKIHEGRLVLTWNWQTVIWVLEVVALSFVEIHQ